uniref:LIM zinc-binding domain-containing protein n=1 Tax=Clastoptera arizonana TaxID=38151 RepID=A0A1B6E0J1_9HEMI
MMKRRYLRHLATQQFKKSMQMLQGNAKDESDNSPFEDYSLFVYRQTAPDFKDRVKDLEMKLLYPDREARLHAELKKASKDEKFSGRVKEIEAMLKGSPGAEKKPKDLLRAIGKIEKTDWNLREIEKKIEENKHSKGKGRTERVPKWSRQQFDDKFSAMERKLKAKGGDDAVANKYSEIDVNIKQLEKKIKEGNVLEPGKVSALAAHLANMNQKPEKPILQKSTQKPALVLPAQGGSEMCHFCNKRVYLMERLNAEGRFFHRGCFRCEYCSTTLRLGSYAFDRDGKFGSRFFCTQHFGLPGTQRMRVRRKSEEFRMVTNKENIPTQNDTDVPDKDNLPTPMDQDSFDRGTTPERIEFKNLSGVVDTSSDLEDAEITEMDEDEWTDRNFGASAAEGSSDEVFDLSDSEEEEEFAEALDVNVGMTDETIRLAKNWTHKHSQKPNRALEIGNNTDVKKDDDESGSCHDSDDSREHFSYQEYDSEDDESDTATDNEQEAKARELRKQEVRLEVPEKNSDSGSDTEVKCSSLPDIIKGSNSCSVTKVNLLSESCHSIGESTPYGTPVTSPPTPDLVLKNSSDSLLLPPVRHSNTINNRDIINQNNSLDSNKTPVDVENKLSAMKKVPFTETQMLASPKPNTLDKNLSATCGNMKINNVHKTSNDNISENKNLPGNKPIAIHNDNNKLLNSPACNRNEQDTCSNLKKSAETHTKPRIKHTPSLESQDHSSSEHKTFVPEYVISNAPLPKSSFSPVSGRIHLDRSYSKKDKKDCIVM